MKMFNLSIAALFVAIGCNAVALGEGDTIVIGDNAMTMWDAPADGGPVENYIVSIGNADCSVMDNTYDTTELTFQIPVEELGVGNYCSFVQAQNTDAHGEKQVGPESNQVMFSIIENIPAPGAPLNYRLVIEK